jgi:hypothetical protein
MIVSHRHRFIFLKTRKTAGTSIEVALSQFCGDRDIITPVAPEDEAVRGQLGYPGPQNYQVPLLRYGKRQWRKLLVDRRRAKFYNHIPAGQARAFLGDRVWNSYYKFCFDRNPWDRMVSAYYWHRFRSGDSDLEFQDFLMQQRPRVLSNYAIYSIDSSVAVDLVGRFENLLPDFNRALAHIGIDEPVELPRLKAKARTDKRPYSEVISPEQQRYIATHCQAEIALMDYRFV